MDGTCAVCGAHGAVEWAHLLAVATKLDRVKDDVWELESPEERWERQVSLNAVNFRDLCRSCHVTFDKFVGAMAGGLHGPWLERWTLYERQFSLLLDAREDAKNLQARGDF